MQQLHTKDNNLKLITDLVNPYLNDYQKEKFLLSLKDNKTYSFILNRQKIGDLSNLNLINGCIKSNYDNITYYHNEKGIGNNLLNSTGSIYIMDASSSLISYYLKDLIQGESLVCDLCSAPGGKSISLALEKDNLSFLCNDISFSRVVEMNKNFSRLGLDNMITISNYPNKISNLKEVFDLVILDAPCSGTGMIRKDKKMISDYSIKKVDTCIKTQHELLSVADKILKKGGILSYSTCSLNIEEDELQIERFLSKHNYEIIEIPQKENIIKGSVGYHLIPGLFEGEGIYFCFLRKKEGNINELTRVKLSNIEGISTFTYKNKEYAIKEMYKEFLDLNIYSPGIKVFDDSPYSKYKYSFEFTHLIKDNYKKININITDAKKYFNGEKLNTELNIPDGYYFLKYNHLPIGLGIKKGNIIQNLLPKRLRLNCQL